MQFRPIPALSLAAATALAAAIQALVPTADAQPLLLLDTAFIHGAVAGTRPEAAFPLPASVPDGWASPVNYAGGTAHFRLEILDKPTGTAIRYQPCLERGASRACATAQTLADSGRTRAVYTWSQALAQWTPTSFAWSTRPDRAVFVLQDAYGRPIVPAGGGNPDPDWVGQPFLQLYYPMQVRVSVAVTAAGAAFPGWGGLIPTGLARPGRGTGEVGAGAQGEGFRGPAVRRSGRLGYVYGTGIGERSIRDAAGRRLPHPAESAADAAGTP